MTYSPGSPGYPPAQQPTTQFAAPTQHFGKAEGLQQAAGVPDRRGRGTRPGGVPVELRPVFHRDDRGRVVHPGAPVPRHCGGSAGRSPRGRKPGAQADGRQRRGGGAVRAGLPVGARDRHHRAQRCLPRLGAVRDHCVHRPSRPSSRSPRCCSTPASSPRRRRGPSMSSSSTASTAAPEGTTGSTASTLSIHGGPPQQQRPGYPTQYGGPRGGPSTGGFSAVGPSSGTPTPPTGFPAYRQPQQPSSSSAPTTQVPAQPQPSSSSTPQSGQTPS